MATSRKRCRHAGDTAARVARHLKEKEGDGVEMERKGGEEEVDVYLTRDEMVEYFKGTGISASPNMTIDVQKTVRTVLIASTVHVGYIKEEYKHGKYSLNVAGSQCLRDNFKQFRVAQKFLVTLAGGRGWSPVEHEDDTLCGSKLDIAHKVTMGLGLIGNLMQLGSMDSMDFSSMQMGGGPEHYRAAEAAASYSLCIRLWGYLRSVVGVKIKRVPAQGDIGAWREVLRSVLHHEAGLGLKKMEVANGTLTHQLTFPSFYKKLGLDGRYFEWLISQEAAHFGMCPDRMTRCVFCVDGDSDAVSKCIRQKGQWVCRDHRKVTVPVDLLRIRHVTSFEELLRILDS